MTELIHNPRRSSRIAVRCSARVALRSGAFFASLTWDVGPGGCGVETPWRVEPGERVFMEIDDARVRGPRLLSGRVAWSASAPALRCGIAFDVGSAHAAAALFEQVAAAYPDAASDARMVESIPADALLAPTPVPGALAALDPAEAEVLGALGAGAEARALRARLGERWEPCLNALFALLGRRAVAVGGLAPEGVPPERA